MEARRAQHGSFQEQAEVERIWIKWWHIEAKGRNSFFVTLSDRRMENHLHFRKRLRGIWIYKWMHLVKSYLSVSMAAGGIVWKGWDETGKTLNWQCFKLGFDEGKESRTIKKVGHGSPWSKTDPLAKSKDQLPQSLQVGLFPAPHCVSS